MLEPSFQSYDKFTCERNGYRHYIKEHRIESLRRVSRLDRYRLAKPSLSHVEPQGSKVDLCLRSWAIGVLFDSKKNLHKKPITNLEQHDSRAYQKPWSAFYRFAEHVYKESIFAKD